MYLNMIFVYMTWLGFFTSIIVLVLFLRDSQKRFKRVPLLVLNVFWIIISITCFAVYWHCYTKASLHIQANQALERTPFGRRSV